MAQPLGQRVQLLMVLIRTRWPCGSRCHGGERRVHARMCAHRSDSPICGSDLKGHVDWADNPLQNACTLQSCLLLFLYRTSWPCPRLVLSQREKLRVMFTELLPEY